MNTAVVAAEAVKYGPLEYAFCVAVAMAIVGGAWWLISGMKKK